MLCADKAEEQKPMCDEPKKKEAQSEKIIELRAILEKELTALLAHPLVPEEFKDFFEDKK